MFRQYFQARNTGRAGVNGQGGARITPILGFAAPSRISAEFGRRARCAAPPGPRQVAGCARHGGPTRARVAIPEFGTASVWSSRVTGPRRARIDAAVLVQYSRPTSGLGDLAESQVALAAYGWAVRRRMIATRPYLKPSTSRNGCRMSSARPILLVQYPSGSCRAPCVGTPLGSTNNATFSTPASADSSSPGLRV